MRSGSRLGLFLLFGPLACAGCATFQQERDAVSRYEKTRDEMNRVAKGDWKAPTYEEEAQRKQKKKPLEIADLAPDNWTKTFRRITGNGPQPAEAESFFKEGERLYGEAVQLREQKQFDAAFPKFAAAGKALVKAADRFPESSLEHNSLFLAGEAYFFADLYSKSNDSFERLLKAHPNSRHLDAIQKRRFAIAQYWLACYNAAGQPGWYVINATDRSRPWNDLFGRAMKVFDRIRLDDPTGNLADDATLMLANSHFARGKVIKADEFYTDLRKTFPNSEHQFTAHFVGLKAKLLCYQGPDYGGTVLDESEKLIDTIRKQFPIEAQNEEDYLKRALAEVRFHKADREYQTAQYYDQKAEYLAARTHYAEVLQSFGDTPFAEPTKTRIAEIGGLPDVPPQPFPWLAEWFPREDNIRPLIATDKPKAKKR